MIVMGSFVVLWLPFFLVNVIWPVCHLLYESHCGINDLVWKIVIFFGYTNSGSWLSLIVSNRGSFRGLQP